jgi:phage FluMu protein Com
MPTLACRICGRVVYTAAAFETLFAEESRCPRCGGVLWPERRRDNRRRYERRVNPTDEPGPPMGAERRVSDRRKGQRRRDDNRSF